MPLHNIVASAAVIFGAISYCYGVPQVAQVCYDQVMNMSCSRGQVIVVRQSTFDAWNYAAHCNDPSPYFCVDISASLPLISATCAGRQTCAFNVDSTYYNENATCYSPHGTLIVTYECINVASIMNVCKLPASLPLSGYIGSPNYPSGYPLSTNCKAEITNGVTSWANITLLDLATEARVPGCYVYLTLSDNLDVYKGEELCGNATTISYPLAFPLFYLAADLLFSSYGHTPMRGFLIQYDMTSNATSTASLPTSATTVPTTVPPTSPPRVPTTAPKTLPPTSVAVQTGIPTQASATSTGSGVTTTDSTIDATDTTTSGVLVTEVQWTPGKIAAIVVCLGVFAIAVLVLLLWLWCRQRNGNQWKVKELVSDGDAERKSKLSMATESTGYQNNGCSESLQCGGSALNSGSGYSNGLPPPGYDYSSYNGNPIVLKEYAADNHYNALTLRNTRLEADPAESYPSSNLSAKRGIDTTEGSVLSAPAHAKAPASTIQTQINIYVNSDAAAAQAGPGQDLSKSSETVSSAGGDSSLEGGRASRKNKNLRTTFNLESESMSF